jgi:predicted Zn-dependent protease
VRRAAQLGAAVGARTYSRTAELEADALGTVIAYRAGYDPLAGAQLFLRLPDPGMRSCRPIPRTPIVAAS